MELLKRKDQKIEALESKLALVKHRFAIEIMGLKAESALKGSGNV